MSDEDSGNGIDDIFGSVANGIKDNIINNDNLHSSFVDTYNLAIRPVNLVEASRTMILILIIPLIAWTLFCYTQGWKYKTIIWMVVSALYIFAVSNTNNVYGNVSFLRKNKVFV